MPTSLLDLPRELRDLIYKHALVSPTGVVFPLANGRLRSSGYSLYVAVDDESCNDTTSYHSACGHTFSVSLHRTCKQVKEETAGLLWSNTIFLLDQQRASIHLKAMGQIASRQIRYVWVDFETSYWKTLPKLFALLSSRARLGSFEKLQLHFHEPSFRMLVAWNISQRPEYDRLLDMLRDESQECNFKRTVRIGRGCVRTPIDADTIRDLHLAFGGRVIYEGTTIWDNYKHVGKSVGV